jgi:8-oxo-dGTP pyrophosphatase MutT (NUDIX family)
MGNARVAELLASHTPADAKEAADMRVIARMLADAPDMPPAAPDIMSQAHEPGHVTGSALVIDQTTGRFLLHHHKTLGRWLQVGGHCDPGEDDPAQTALREAREETGLPDLRLLADAPIDIDVHPIPARVDRPAHLHLDIRYALVTALPDAVQAGEGESTAFAWLTPVDLAARGEAVEPALARLIEKALRLFHGDTR